MAEMILFRIRNRFPFSLNAIYDHFLLFSFFIFFTCGNFFRFFPLPPFPSHFSFAEGLLYFLAFFRYFTKFRKSQFFLLLICFSTLYGTLLHGADLGSILYAFKLIAMIIAGISIGEILIKKFGPDRKKCLNYFIKLFLIILVLGIFIFLFFPHAELFFQFLEGYGISFLGDPHQRRFISPFFDPNFYSAIACIPLILTSYLKNRGLFFLFFLSILLTFSRSGITTCFLLLICMGFSHAIYLQKIQIQKWPIWMGFFILCTLTLMIFSEEFLYFLNRFIYMKEDLSAHARLESFQEGWKYFWKHPWFGMGYNYLSKIFYEDLQIFSPDSSLLSTLVNFGFIPCSLFFLYGFYWFFLRFKKKPSKVLIWLYIYLLICILFTSQFNHLLYYPYWLIPMIALLKYLEAMDENCFSS